jgi:uncharacterized protein YegP (UPF0339 family)
MEHLYCNNQQCPIGVINKESEMERALTNPERHGAYERPALKGRVGRYEFWQSEKNGKWYFNCVAPNGEVQHPSQGYTTKGSCVAAIGRCMEDTTHYNIVQRHHDDIEKERIQREEPELKDCTTKVCPEGEAY